MAITRSAVLILGLGVFASAQQNLKQIEFLEPRIRPVHVHDLHATMLHALGLNHERLTYRYSGRDMRLTDVEGHVVKSLLL